MKATLGEAFPIFIYTAMLYNSDISRGIKACIVTWYSNPKPALMTIAEACQSLHQTRLH
ncbi:hypothetical protein [Thermosphaera aggregans]|uniref:hypothetical protein n=1 Tax=Thermosphaera aggregans TaxID=54254 RepID=UPI0014940C61|nr:hypothetical protein [Thermosphaera aggregans]